MEAVRSVVLATSAAVDVVAVGVVSSVWRCGSILGLLNT
jgi:hypothetical protein